MGLISPSVEQGDASAAERFVCQGQGYEKAANISSGLGFGVFWVEKSWVL